MAWEVHGVIKGPKGDIPVIESATQPVETEVLWVDTSDPGDSGGGTTFDTGWRDVSGELEAGWDGPLLVRRVGQFVCFGSTDSPLFGPGGGGEVVWIPPQGWRPVGLSALPSYFGTGAVTARPTQIDVAGGNPWGPGGSYITDDPEPDPGDWPGVPWTP